MHAFRFNLRGKCLLFFWKMWGRSGDGEWPKSLKVKVRKGGEKGKAGGCRRTTCRCRKLHSWLTMGCCNAKWSARVVVGYGKWRKRRYTCHVCLCAFNTSHVLLCGPSGRDGPEPASKHCGWDVLALNPCWAPPPRSTWVDCHEGPPAGARWSCL